MKGLAALGWMLCLGMALTGAPVAARESTVDMPVQGRENVSFAFADVLRATPTYEISRTRVQTEECEEPASLLRRDRSAERSTERGERLPGSIVPDPPSRRHGSAERNTGEGRDTESNTPQRNCIVHESEREERRISGYEVEYTYKGHVYMSRMDYDPGHKLRIRITVAPAD